MAQNFSEYLNDLQEKKVKLLALAQKAAEFDWIPKTKDASKNTSKDIISLEEIVEKIEKDTLTIGVIGQMKCGKSTFLNSFVFEKDVLPAATTPMTAALSVITYGEREHVVAEFYTADEWAEQQMQAKRDENEATDLLDKSKIKAAKELVEKSKNLGTSLEGYLGKTQEDSFNNLIEYVGADGKYVSITKSVTIYYPKDYLKGVEIVDTPGFNDPIVSREERTKEFLKKADVVIMMLYAGRPFDSTDRDIIFKNVRQCGVGKVLVGINKYDIPYCSDTNPEDETQIKEYVREEIRKACRECHDNTLVEILNEVEPIPFSAEMALLSELPMSKISSTDALDFAWKRHCSNFGIGTQAEMYKWSHIEDLVSAVKLLINNEKSKILFAKPLNAIFAAGSKLKSENENKLAMINSRIELLKTPDADIEEKERDLSKVHRRLSKKIGSLDEDWESEIRNIIRKGEHDLEDDVDESCRRMSSIIHNEWSCFKSFDSVSPKLEAELQNLITRKLRRKTESIAEEGKRKINRHIDDFFVEAESLLMRFLPEFDSREFVRSTQNKIQLDIEDKDLFAYTSESGGDNNSLEDYLFAFLNGASWGVLGLAGDILNHNEAVAQVERNILSIKNDFDPKPYLENAFKSKDEVINVAKKAFITELIEPLQEQITDIRTKKNNQEEELKAAEIEREELEKKKSIMIDQFESISQLKSAII